MPRITSKMARGAEVYWGGQVAAARGLGVSPNTFKRLLRGQEISDKSQHKIDARWRRLSADQRYTIHHGDDLWRSLSHPMTRKLRLEGFKGRRAAKSSRKFQRDRLEIPEEIFDFLDEVYGGESRR